MKGYNHFTLIFCTGLLLTVVCQSCLNRDLSEGLFSLWDETNPGFVISSGRQFPVEGPWVKYGPDASILDSDLICGVYGFDHRQGQWVVKVNSHYTEEWLGVYFYKHCMMVTGNGANEWQNKLNTVVILTNEDRDLETLTYMQYFRRMTSSYYDPSFEDWLPGRKRLVVQSIFWEAPCAFPPGNYVE